MTGRLDDPKIIAPDGIDPGHDQHRDWRMSEEQDVSLFLAGRAADQALGVPLPLTKVVRDLVDQLIQSGRRRISILAFYLRNRLKLRERLPSCVPGIPSASLDWARLLGIQQQA